MNPIDPSAFLKGPCKSCGSRGLVETIVLAASTMAQMHKTIAALYTQLANSSEKAEDKAQFLEARDQHITYSGACMNVIVPDEFEIAVKDGVISVKDNTSKDSERRGMRQGVVPGDVSPSTPVPGGDG